MPVLYDWYLTCKSELFPEIPASLIETKDLENELYQTRLMIA
jgi:hypothetical protein